MFLHQTVTRSLVGHCGMLAYPDRSVHGVFMTDDAHDLSLSSHRDPPGEVARRVA